MGSVAHGVAAVWLCMQIWLTLGGRLDKGPLTESNILDFGAIFPIKGKGGWQGGQVSTNERLTIRSTFKKNEYISITFLEELLFGILLGCR